jgi:hypothetical protein
VVWQYRDSAGRQLFVQSLGGSRCAAQRPPMEASGVDVDVCIAAERDHVEVDVAFGPELVSNRGSCTRAHIKTSYHTPFMSTSNLPSC